VRDDGALLGKALDVLGLAGQKALRNQQREVGIDVAQLLELAIENALDVLPDRVPVGPDHHTAARGAVIGQFRGLDDVLIPSAVVFAALGDLCHDRPLVCRLRGGISAQKIIPATEQRKPVGGRSRGGAADGRDWPTASTAGNVAEFGRNALRKGSI